MMAEPAQDQSDCIVVLLTYKKRGRFHSIPDAMQNRPLCDSSNKYASHLQIIHISLKNLKGAAAFLHVEEVVVQPYVTACTIDLHRLCVRFSCHCDRVIRPVDIKLQVRISKTIVLRRHKQNKR